MDYDKLGMQIKKARNKIKMSQQELAFETEYSVQHISHVEKARTKLSVEFLVKAANALHVTTDQLLCDSLECAGAVYQGEVMEELEDCSKRELKIILQLVQDTKKNLRENM